MLMKPRRWLGYSILLNDLLSTFEEILNRFETSEIPLDDTFGSSSDPPTKPTRFILLIGPGVEVERLNEVLKLLDGLGPEFIHPETDGAYRKHIYIGSNYSEKDLIIPLLPKLKEKLINLTCSPEELTEYLKNINTLKAV